VKSGIDLKAAFGLKPEAAIEYFKSKGYAITWDWHEMLDEAHAKAFTVAKVLRADVLQDIHDSLTSALDTGITYREWAKSVTPTLKSKGWWGEVVNPATGELATVGPWRLKTIYDTNIQTAYSVGRYRAQVADSSRPFWEYVAVMDARTRPAHAALNGSVFPSDDPFWSSFYPPNGWRCRCRVRSHSEDELKEQGLASGSSSGDLGSKEVKLKGGASANVATFSTMDPQSGKRVTVSPDVGFSYNPGVTPWKPDTGKYSPKLREVSKIQDSAQTPTAPATSKLAAALARSENSIATLKHEKALVFDEQGNLVLEKVGKKNHVEFTRDEIDGFKGKTLVHNHPSGGPFSEADIKVAARSELAEIRAVGKSHVYSMKPPAKGWSKYWWDQVGRGTFTQVRSEVYADLRKWFADGILTRDEANDITRRYHEIWKRFATKTGTIYEQIER
jgi:SPP1 gp7 family putative phage head morphogenesis protein